MSYRLGCALVEYLRRHLDPTVRSFVLIEGVPISVAEGMSRSWDDTLPDLAVVSSNPTLFGRHAMRGTSGTGLRNRREGTGVVLVLCGGEQLEDRQSLNLFESIAPSSLLESPEGIAILAQQHPAVGLDGPVRAVREAINQADVSTRPSAVSVAEYFDAIAAGGDPLEELPILGAFTDRLGPGERADASRILDNLSLAARRTSETVLRPSSFADLRKRAETVLRRRPGVGEGGAAAVADEVMRQLQTGSPDLLRELRFDEAREILEQRSQDLTELVLAEILKFQASPETRRDADGLPWDRYKNCADELRRAARRREAARELCGLDDAHQRRVFSTSTRAKLERLTRDRSISGSNPSCPESALIKARLQLGCGVSRVQVLSPTPSGSSAANQSAAGRILTLACARLRLGRLMRAWSDSGCDVDGLLLRPADGQDLCENLLAAFSDAGLARGSALPALQLRLYGENGSTVQVDWRPDLDDAGTLRSALLFAVEPTTSLLIDPEPALQTFCGTDSVSSKPVNESLVSLARELQTLARRSLDSGLDPQALQQWATEWAEFCQKHESAHDASILEDISLVGAVKGGGNTVALTPFAPMKSEWLAQYLTALWELIDESIGSDGEASVDAVTTANGIARTTASHHPAYIRLATQDRPLLPTSEGRIWSLFGGTSSHDGDGHAGDAFAGVIEQLLKLQPEAAGHFRCLTWGPGAADLVVEQAVRLVDRQVGSARIHRIELFCVGLTDAERPRPETLARADEDLRGGRDALEIRYIDSLDEAVRLLKRSSTSPAVHLALVTGLTEGGNRLQIDSREVDPPAHDNEVLFSPRVWQRPKQDRRTLLMPPTATSVGQAWLRLQHAIDDGWPEPDAQITVPELRTGTFDIANELQTLHDLALWVATLDRYTTRDSLEQSLGKDRVAILHQERRLGGDCPLSLVISQKSGSSTDRAIGRSLRVANIVSDRDVALSIGTQLREVASQGYGILALQAATTGAGINELVGHVVAFSLLSTAATPWPLPPGCRVLLVSLDEYQHWFPNKRADLLAIALDTNDGGVHVAAIEVKARRDDVNDAASGAFDQLTQTIAATRWAAYPEVGSIHSRLWLNRIAEAAYAVARESRFRLDAEELRALEAFRLGRGTLEWAGVGLVFGPKIDELNRIHRVNVSNDIVPIVLRSVRLTEDLLRTATNTSLTGLRTVESEQPPLESTRRKRRPEGLSGGKREPQAIDDGEGHSGGGEVVPASDGDPGTLAYGTDRAPASEDSGVGNVSGNGIELATSTDRTNRADTPPFVAPLLGWDAETGEEIRWHAAGPEQRALQNGHMEVWGSSGMGKTQFTMSFLAQLSMSSGSHFGIADFKNDYSDDTGFPDFGNATFVDLWNGGAPYNPLALDEMSDRAIQSAIIELRDTVDEAVRSMGARLGHRQRSKLEKALQHAYNIGLSEKRWPTLLTLDDELDDDLRGVIGDLTRNNLFGSGEPLGEVINKNVVFGLSKIPGNGQTTVLAAGFIFSALLLKVQSLPPVPNTIRYILVVDEAHRVAPFKAIQTMIREGRSKGLAVVLATQGPVDLPDVVAANAQTKVCFGLPDATVATMAARKLQPDNPRLARQIRTLGKGEAFVSFAGEPPRLVRMVQAYRDSGVLGLPALR